MTARVAGSLYFVTIVAGIFSLICVPAHVSVHGDIVATANKIIASQTLYRWGILIGAIGYVAFTLVPLAVLQVRGSVHRATAVSMVVLALIAMPIDFLALANQLDLLTLLVD